MDPRIPAPAKSLTPAISDPDFLRASDWLARACEAPRAYVLGAPYGGGSLSRARCDLAPAAVRRALSRFSVWNSDRAISLESFAVRDAGDIEPASDVAATQERIAAATRALVGGGEPVVLIGGDNSVTVGGARGVDADGLLTFDAHHDCRDPDGPNGPTNGSPVRQLVNAGMSNVVQVGIHGFANAEPHARWALAHGVHVISANRVRAGGMTQTVEGALGLLGTAKRIWVDVDLDVLDRAFAPGAPASMPGGLTPGDLQEAAFLLGREPRVAGLDLTEFDPTADVADMTARAACSVLLSFLAGVSSR